MLTIDLVIEAAFLWLIGLMPYIYILLVAILVNLALGVAVALKTGAFEWAELGKFLYSDVLSKFIAWLAISFLVSMAALVGVEMLGKPLAPELTMGLTVALWGLVMLSIGGDILTKVGLIGFKPIARIPGVDVPKTRPPI